ncbi:MAG TPA: FAD-dependent oxidoreductase [Thermoanaerobaculia bacterium]|jgi:monoamine oxidase|nr:FAD-dependent oxidoreductase [Thermoanaerobaculia bacterium]
MTESGGWTRRGFLERVGIAGGAAAVYETMVALGMLRTPPAYAGAPRPQRLGSGKSVLVLGAGIGGLTATHELLKAEYHVEVLEAADRIGGRSFTVRRGDVIEQAGFPDQTCRFDAGLYFNAGPGRIPYHHQALIGYCRELGVELEVYVMEDRAALFQTDQAFAGKPVADRQVANDTRGYIAELLAKAIDKRALDDELSAADRRDLLQLLAVFGDVDPEEHYRYAGSTRSGYRVPPAVVEPGDVEPPLPLQSLLKSRFWDHRFYQPEDYEWQATMFQPVGGMDRVVRAFERAIGAERITRGVEVVKIESSDGGVQVTFERRGQGRARETRKADYCISTIPLPLLKKLIDNETFSPDFKGAVAVPKFEAAAKVGWQAEERFWESPRHQIYGGISWIDHPITQFWYPSSGTFSAKGVLTGAYNYADTAREFGALPLDQRLMLATQGAERLHPEFLKFVKSELGLSIAWHQVPHQLGGWADWDWGKPEHAAAYNRLLAPDKRFFVCGDQVSYLSGWQEGAVLSAHHVVRQLTTAAPLAVTPPTPKAPPRRAPRTRRIVGAGAR